MSRAHSRARASAALFVGTAHAAAMSAGIALLLYTGQGFLRAAGLLISSTILAVSAGVWAGAPERGEPVATRQRWFACALAFIVAGLFAGAWNARPVLREAAVAGALAVLLMIAVPAYVAGVLLAGLHARSAAGGAQSSGVAAAAAAGAALGVLLATTVLIQQLEPYGIYYGAAGVVALAALLDRAATAARTGVSDMSGQVILITGVGEPGQFGYTLARRALDAGASVIISARTDAVQARAGELSEFGSVAAVVADLARDEDAARLIDFVRERHGRLDALLNVAGGLSVTGPVQDTDAADWVGEYERNTVTALRMCRAALPLLRESRGSIINFASPAGERAVPKLGAYSAAKAGVIALTRALAVEERATGVRVNAIAPGPMDTEQNRADAEGSGTFVGRDEVADVALFLAGPGGRGVSGEVVHVLGRTLR